MTYYVMSFTFQEMIVIILCKVTPVSFSAIVVMYNSYRSVTHKKDGSWQNLIQPLRRSAAEDHFRKEYVRIEENKSKKSGGAE